MTDSPSATSNSAAEQNAEVLGLLKQILALPDTKRRALGRAWTAMDGSLFEVVAADREDDDLDANDSATKGAERLNAWLLEVQKMPAKARAAKLQAALEQEDEDWAILILQTELGKLKNAQPWLAVELAVGKYAYEHPVLMLVALSGLGLGLYRLGKAILAIVF